MVGIQKLDTRPHSFEAVFLGPSQYWEGPGVSRVRSLYAEMGWHWFRGMRADHSCGMWRCFAQLPTHTWKLHLARQPLLPSWQHLTRWWSMLDCHHRVNLFRLLWSRTVQSSGMLFSSWMSWVGQSMVHYQTNLVISVIFVPPGVFPGKKNNNEVFSLW